MPPPSPARRAGLKDTLLACAERIIADRGLAALKARDLASAAGCAVGAIYTAYPDLETLVLAVNLRTLTLFEGYVARATSAAPGSVFAADTEAAMSRLVALSSIYVDFASDHPQRWRALFQHRMSDDRAVPSWYVVEQVRLFGYIEGPLAVLRPTLGEPQRHLLARTLFSATHGIVSLGFDQKLLALPMDVLRDQVTFLVRACAIGLSVGGVDPPA